MKRAAAVLAAALALALAGAASGATCGHFCRDRLVVEAGEVVRWESPEVFGSNRGDSAVNLIAYVNGRALWSEWNGCRGYYFSRGVALRVRTCGDPTTIRISAVTFGGDRRVLLRYQGGS